MSLNITHAEAQALSVFVCRCRPDWDHPGVMAAIGKARNLGPAAAVGAALCRLAENRDMRTPALLAEPGPHWGGTSVADRKPPTLCPDHPTSRARDCQPCADAALPDPAEAARAVRRALQEAMNR